MVTAAHSNNQAPPQDVPRRILPRSCISATSTLWFFAHSISDFPSASNLLGGQFGHYSFYFGTYPIILHRCARAVSLSTRVF